MWTFIVGSPGSWSCLLWAQQAVRWVPDVVAIPRSGDLMAENVSFNLKNSLGLPGVCRQGIFRQFSASESNVCLMRS